MNILKHRTTINSLLLFGLLNAVIITEYLHGLREGRRTNIQDVVCDNALDADLAFHLEGWTPMHDIERPVMDQAISEEHQTLSCRAYAHGMVIKFPANQRWVKRTDSTTHKVRR